MPDAAPDPTLSEALVALQAQLPRIAKNEEGQVGTRTYKYANLSVITDALMPILSRVGLAFTARPTFTGDHVVLLYTLHHVSGEEISGEYPLPSSGTPQQMGSAITYARRYALCAITGVAPVEDDDDAAAAERAAQSDAERDAAGRMTKEQQKEHAALRKLEQPRKADRSSGPADDDQWAGQPAGEWQDVTPEDKPGSSNARQHRSLSIAYSALGITDRDQRLAEMTNRVGREITSAKDLSYQEADAAIKALEALVARREEAEAR